MSTFAQRSKALAIAGLLAIVATLGFVLAPGGVAQAEEPSLVPGAPALEAQDGDATTYTLAAVNEEKMWKVVQVEVEDYASGQDYMTVYITSSPSSYPYSFGGTQDEAAATFDNMETDARWVTAPVEKTFDPAVSYMQWNGTFATTAKGYGHRYPITIPEGKAQFTQDAIFISGSYGTLTARRIDVNLDTMTATCGSGHDIASIAVSSDVADVTAADTGSIDYTGYVGPYAGNQSQAKMGLSNDWKSTLTVKLADNSVYDKAYAVKYETSKPADYDETMGNVVEVSDNDIAAVSTDGTLALPVFNDYNSNPMTKQLNRNVITVMMHVSGTAPYQEADQWVERKFQLDFSSRTEATLTISGDDLTPKKCEALDYSGDTYKLVKSDLTSPFGMLSPNPASSLKVAKYNNRIRVEYTPKNTSVYSGIYLDADIRLQDTWDPNKFIPITENSDLVFFLDASYAGKAWPIAPVKPDGVSTTSTQYYMAIPSLDKIPEFAIENGVYALPKLGAGPSDMFNHVVSNSGTIKIDGDSATLMFSEDGSTASVGKYSRLALGKSSELLTGNYQPDSVLPQGTVIVEGVFAGNGDKGAKWAFAVPLSKAEAVNLVFNPDEKLYVTVWNNVGSSTDKIPGWYKASNDIFMTTGFVGGTAADYTALIAALANVPADLSVYSEATVNDLNAAIAAIEWGKGSSEQESVESMAGAIQTAITNLKTKEEAFNEAIEALPAIDSITADNPDAVKAAEDAIAAYNALSDEQKANVSGAVAAKIIAAQAKVAAIRLAEAVEAATPTDLSAATVTVAGATYTGKALTPAVSSVKLGETALVQGTDFEVVSYANNVNAGTGIAMIKGIGKYTGAATGTFAISKAANPLVTKAASKTLKFKTLKKKAQSFTPAVIKTKGQGTVTYAKKSVTAKFKKYVTVAKNGKITFKKGAPKGKCVLVLNVKAAGNGNYNAKTVTAKVTINVK